MPRGVLISVDKILLADGTKVQTFIDCDAGYLEEKEVAIGDVVSFTYVGGSRHAAEIEKVTATAKERELQRYAKAKAPAKAKAASKARAPSKAKARTPAELGDLLVARSLIGRVTPKQLAKACEALDDGEAEDAAFRFLIHLPTESRPVFVHCDHHVERRVVTDLNRALDGELSLRIDKEAPAKLELTLLVDGKPVGTHLYDDTLTLLQWIQQQLVDHGCESRLYYLPCYEGHAVVIITEEQCEALRDASIPIEAEAPLY